MLPNCSVTTLGELRHQGKQTLTTRLVDHPWTVFLLPREPERHTAAAGRSYREADGPVAALYRTLTATMRESARREWLKRGLHCPKLVCPLAEHPKLQAMRGD
jgi:hypothetical protein